MEFPLHTPQFMNVAAAKREKKKEGKHRRRSGASHDTTVKSNRRAQREDDICIAKHNTNLQGLRGNVNVELICLFKQFKSTIGKRMFSKIMTSALLLKNALHVCILQMKIANM